MAGLSRSRVILETAAMVLLFVAVSPSAVAYRSRQVLRTLGDGVDPPDVALDLNATSFEAALRSSPARFAVVEFFAHWCPACRNYKPHYERVARLFNGPQAAHPGIVVMTRVDCADKMNTNLCDRFSINHYPILFWGRPSVIASARWPPKEGKGDIKEINDPRPAEHLLNWINKELGSSFSLDDEKYENEITLPYNASDPAEVARAIFDVEEATASAFDIILRHKMISSDTRSPMIKFLQLLAAHHPSKRCRKGSADVLVTFDDTWPSDFLSQRSPDTIAKTANNALENFWICGKEVPRGYWMFCRGSKNETRGFSCGLWVLLHSLSIRVGDGESQSTFSAICEFIHNFFVCQECREHFYEMCSSVSVPVNSTRDFSLWLWSTHNRVNVRLMQEEKSSRTADPKFPKMIWPPKQLCPTCYLSQSTSENGTLQIEWNNDEVFKFLVNYYGKMLVSSHKETTLTVDKATELDDVATSTNAVAVPIGAALGIALASCTFGALAWFWRMQQKKRKYIYQPHYLKSI